jgi:hypothetical protein
MAVSFDDFKLEWLSDVTKDDPSSVELGNRFSRKIIMQWLELDEYSDDVVFCDGSGDGGIDIAYLNKGGLSEDGESEGDTWYIIQSKYGSAFKNTVTLLEESKKFFDTIQGHRYNLSSLSVELVERLRNFVSSKSDRDKLILVFATIDSLTADEQRVLDDIRQIGKKRLGDVFEDDAVCIETIYKRIVEQENVSEKLKVSFTGQLVLSGDELLVGSIKLVDLYNFLKEYKNKAGDLDLIYEKNVRKFLGNKRKVNRGIEKTLLEKPERFGLYNNGITIVVEEFEKTGENSFILTDPFIVNGCQTTKTIWSVLLRKLDSGGTGKNAQLDDYREKLDKGIVVVKVVKVGSQGDQLLVETTRYTNSQNGVTEKDFLALEKDFRAWSDKMGSQYGIYLEIQRGGWDSWKAQQKQNPTTSPLYKEYASCFDLIKVYSAGWLGEAGLAFGKNPPFAPGGSIFTQIINDSNFGLDDLYAAYILSREGDQYKFGRGADKSSRGQTRYLFFMIVIELLKDAILRANPNTLLYSDKAYFTKCILNLSSNGNLQVLQDLLGHAIDAIDEYMTKEKDDSYNKEPTFRNDINAFLKSDQIGKGEATPRLKSLIESYKRLLKRSPLYERLLECVTDDNVEQLIS